MSESTEESRTNISLESEPKKLQPSSKKSEKKFLCKICLKNFSTKGNLKNHINTIHNNYYPFKCPYSNCSHSYSNKSRLEVHIRTHTGIKPFQCNLCNKFFNEKGNLKTHINFHKNIRTFQCKICNKKYKTNGHLKDHIQIQHLKIKKFKCEKCGCLFGRKSSLNSHMKIYTGNKMYVCEIKGCGKKFYEKGNMKMHYKRHLKKLEKINNKNNDNININNNNNKNNNNNYNNNNINNNDNIINIKNNNNNNIEMIENNVNFIQCLTDDEFINIENNNNNNKYNNNNEDIFIIKEEEEKKINKNITLFNFNEENDYY